MSQHHVRDAFHKELLVNLTDLSQRYCNACDSRLCVRYFATIVPSLTHQSSYGGRFSDVNSWEPGRFRVHRALPILRINMCASHDLSRECFRLDFETPSTRLLSRAGEARQEVDGRHETKRPRAMI